MALFDEQPQWFRFIFLLLAGVLLLISSFSLYRHASTPTDESRFRTSPGNLYIIKNIYGKPHIPVYEQPESEPQTEPGDSVLVGDLLLFVDEQRFRDVREIEQYLDTLGGNAEVEMVIFRPEAVQELAYIVQKKDISDSSLRKISSTVYVSEVTEGGVSARAGLQVGDLLYRINGQRFKDAYEAMRILRTAESNRSITYDILRDDQRFTLQIILASVGIQLSILTVVLCGFMFMGSGIFIAVQRPQFRAARLLGLTFLATGYFLTVIFHRDVDTGIFAFVRGFLMVFSILLSFPLWLHMLHYFPIERPELIRRKWIRRSGYSLAIILMIAMVISRHRSGLWAIFTLLLYNLMVLFMYRKECSEGYRSLSRLTSRTTMAVMMSIGLFFLILYTWAPPEATHLENVTGAFIGIPLTLIPLSYLYTIGHYRLLELDIRVRRNIQYSFLSTIWGILIVGIWIGLLVILPMLNLDLPNVRFKGTYIEIIDEPMDAAQKQLMERIVLMFLGIGITYLFWKIRRFGQRFIDQAYNRSQYDYRRAAGILAEVMATQFTMIGLAKGIVEKLAQLMQVKQVGILFFRNEKSCCCREAYGMEEQSWKTFCIHVDQKIVDLIQQNRTDYRFSVEYLPGALREAFMQSGFRHIISIRSKEKLVGVLLIGEKRSESPFHKEDLMFLSAVAKQASVAIENAFLYEELAEQERLKLELEIARRIQIASLPQTTPQIKGLEIAGISIPAQEVGGDYFDYLNGVADEITIIVGDVSGKGTSAALYMSKTQGIIRSLHDFGLSPRQLFIRANQLLTGDLEKKSFITAVGAAFKAKQNSLVLARAGHLPMYYYQARKKSVEIVCPRGMGLGLTRSQKFATELEEKELLYESGDVFVFITDGITEAHSGNGQEFGEEGLLKILRDSNSASAKRIRDHIITAVNQFAGNVRQHDDVTVVVVKVR